MIVTMIKINSPIGNPSVQLSVHPTIYPNTQTSEHPTVSEGTIPFAEESQSGGTISLLPGSWSCSGREKRTHREHDTKTRQYFTRKNCEDQRTTWRNFLKSSKNWNNHQVELSRATGEPWESLEQALRPLMKLRALNSLFHLQVPGPPT